MLEEGVHKELLEDDYEQHRALAEKYRERGVAERAASHYRKCAEVLRDVADLESSEKLAEKRRSLADNLASAADTLEAAGESGETDAGDGDASRPGNASRPGDDVGVSGPSESETRGQSADEAVADAETYLEPPPELDFEDVGGMSDLKQTLIDAVVDPLQRPDLYEKYDLGVVNGVLLYGPPGTGKTYITRALAGKLGYSFIDVTPSDVTSSLVGEAADNVADLFSVARANQPCLVFVDEIDAIAGQRSGGARKTNSERQMVNQLLTELTEIQGEDVVVFAATNLLESVDDAIKRSGRFDERIEVPPPDETARRAILRVHLRDRPVLSEVVDWDRMAELTDGYVASDLELVATTAARKALQEARDRDELQPVTQEHLEAAIEETESSLDAWNG
ncbi:MAG: 26S protease regulatory subunit [Haloarculaceae archaeon]